jgi:hypothetical protein
MTLPIKDISNLLPLAGKSKLDSLKSQVTATNNRGIFNNILQEALNQPNNPSDFAKK